MVRLVQPLPLPPGVLSPSWWGCIAVALESAEAPMKLLALATLLIVCPIALAPSPASAQSLRDEYLEHESIEDSAVRKCMSDFNKAQYDSVPPAKHGQRRILVQNNKHSSIRYASWSETRPCSYGYQGIPLDVERSVVMGYGEAPTRHLTKIEGKELVLYRKRPNQTIERKVIGVRRPGFH